MGVAIFEDLPKVMLVPTYYKMLNVFTQKARKTPRQGIQAGVGLPLTWGNCRDGLGLILWCSDNAWGSSGLRRLI